MPRTGTFRLNAATIASFVTLFLAAFLGQAPAASPIPAAFSPAESSPPLGTTASRQPVAVPGPAAQAKAQAPAPTQTPATAAAPSLQEVLAKAAEYCRKLESSAFDFVCREEIRETVDPKYDALARQNPKSPASVNDLGVGASNYMGPTITISTVNKIKRSFVYDYQCIRASRTIRETRTELEENGKKMVRENAELQTSVIVFGTALLAPVGVFGERFQPGFDFSVAAEERNEKTKAVVLVVDSKPKPGAPQTRNLYGQAWIDAATGNILKIEWSEDRVGNFDVFEKRGELYKRKPRLIIRSEFSAEKNGIRFPSHLYVEETYLKDSGKPFIRSKTDVVYKDFKFFTVEYEVGK
jgi:hypothetical protein